MERMTGRVRSMAALSGIIMLLSFVPAEAINKCIDASGKVAYSDDPCESGSKTESFEPNLKAPVEGVPPSRVPVWTGRAAPSGGRDEVRSNRDATPPRAAASGGRDAACEEMDRVRTPEEMIARAKAIARGEIPERQVCCMNGKVVPCNSAGS